jgi:acetylornithine deacetylase
MADDVVRLTERLVAADSSPGASTDAVAALLAERLAALGASVARQDGAYDGVPQCNLVARFGGDAPAGLVLAGHLDTVPWQRGQRATTSPERDGRTLYGRGSCDMKGPIAAQVLAAARTAGSLRRPLVLLYSYAEEIGCHGALHLVRDRAPLGAVDGAACIVGEPTGCAPVIAHKGYAVAHLRLSGLPVHSSDPWRGVDASAALAVLLTRLHALREELRAHPDTSSGLHPPCTTLNTGLVRAGTAENVVPERAEVVLEWRPLPGADSEALRRAVQACLDAACEAVPGVQGKLDWPVPLPPFRQPADAPLVRWLVERTGQQPMGVPFYTEAELYRSGLNLPSVVCGPGSIAQAHRVDESIQFDELENGVELYADAIRQFCS